MTQHYFDDKCYELTRKNKNMCVPWFLMACFAYDKLDNPIISDACFDEISTEMYNNWKDIRHYHKKFIKYDKDNKKGSSINVVKYPNIVIGATYSLINKR